MEYKKIDELHSPEFRASEFKKLVFDEKEITGQCFLILLSGTSGSGKTLMVESSDLFQRPLLRIGSMKYDLTQHVSQKIYLKQNIENAKVWKGLVLLEGEAPTTEDQRPFLERAAGNDDFLSSFVRQIEYFKGIVFMTTDLTDPIDAAVKSRAQIHLTFSSLTSPMRMQVWRNFIDVVPKEVGVLSEVDITGLAKWKMNGREIKNTINMVITWCQKNNKPLDIGAVEDLISLVSPFATKESSPGPAGDESYQDIGQGRFAGQLVRLPLRSGD
ncbi:hypothetical protein B0T26DRAFT_671021 [Lasiosphaeria miniovina]|uniref:ATPase AAA-type core domain-containing protein n=1 Tax=Lasiosphaeria miniovina TaxID=1954250 RepID=A0AA40ECC5_9PEZI|nr:uncharacterized protein B0T26DRAFT_671021 [Lasiosphaeria miniovina]KAK0734780.1 hypothetical protein B0T26DRAFT_671021 [Lasiosphaeria miniovina]